MTTAAKSKPATAHCPYCAEEIKPEAVKCKHCGEFISPELAAARTPQNPINPGTAAVLSFFIPGAGQMYKGAIGEGFLWLFFVMLGYLAFFVPGFILHILCVLNAHTTYQYINTPK